MKRAWVVLVILLAGCAMATKESRAPERADMTHTPAEPSTIGEAPYVRPPESSEMAGAPERERSVSFPESVEVAAAPALPARPLVAVAFVRSGKLVRQADALRRLAHDFERDARIVALERLPADVPALVDMDTLTAHAGRQGAALLVVDVRRADDARTTYVLTTTSPWQAVAFTKPLTPEPAGQELVARLVRSSRLGP